MILILHQLPRINIQNVNKKNTQLIGKTDLAYTYIGFKFGHMDKTKNEAVMDKDKFKDVRLRQAMAYAIDREKLGEKYIMDFAFQQTLQFHHLCRSIIITMLGHIT